MSSESIQLGYDPLSPHAAVDIDLVKPCMGKAVVLSWMMPLMLASRSEAYLLGATCTWSSYSDLGRSTYANVVVASKTGDAVRLSLWQQFDCDWLKCAHATSGSIDASDGQAWHGSAWGVPMQRSIQTIAIQESKCAQYVL